jgi:hypothetical protein
MFAVINQCVTDRKLDQHYQGFEPFRWGGVRRSLFGEGNRQILDKHALQLFKR